MKCIQRSGKIERVKDKVAEEAVAKGEATYTTKQAWRKGDTEWSKRSESNKKALEDKNKDKYSGDKVA
jgi:hypothetical protein